MTTRTTDKVTAEGADEMVDHPTHYNAHPSGVECIELIRDMPFSLGSAVKYVWRWGLKAPGRQDLEKALWYSEDYRRSKVKRWACSQSLRLLFDQVIAAEPDVRLRHYYAAIARGDNGEASRAIKGILSGTPDSDS